MPAATAVCLSDNAWTLARHALRAICDAQTVGRESHSPGVLLTTAELRAEQLRTNHLVLWGELRRTIASVALGERAAGRPPQEMLIAIKDLVDDSGLDYGLRHQIEPDVVRWGIEAYYSA